MSKLRSQHSAGFKAMVALGALHGIEPVHTVATKHGVHPVKRKPLVGQEGRAIRIEFSFSRQADWAHPRIGAEELDAGSDQSAGQRAFVG